MVPSLENIRLASLQDLPRISTVAAASFFWSPTFQFQRPLHGQYPQDTVESYWQEYQSALSDPESVVLVVEDTLVDDELDHVYEALRGSSSYFSEQATVAKFKGIVGVCSIKLKPGSSYIGQFQTGVQVEGLKQPKAFTNLTRDQCTTALRIYNDATGPAKAKYLGGMMRCSTLAVHPAYWRRGHATQLITWCTRLADQDDAYLGISATPKGAIVAAKAGFEECEIVKIERSAVREVLSHTVASNMEEVQLWIGVRRPCGSPSSETATLSESPSEESQ